MIESVHYTNFKALREASLALGRFTLVVGPNGSGKSTALQALQAVSNPSQSDFRRVATAGVTSNDNAVVQVVVRWGPPFEGAKTTSQWFPNRYTGPTYWSPGGLSKEAIQSTNETLAAIRLYSFDAEAMTLPVQLQPLMRLDQKGANLAGVLDLLQSREPERFGALNEELGRLLPEFDRVLLDTPTTGHKSILLRTRGENHKIEASELSQGTLLALAILTLAYVPDPPPVVCLEEPDRGIHPRLLRDIRDALYRLSYPENFGEKRNAVQVVATTHSPYLLDLFKDHPEEVVIANKVDQDVRFERLSDRADIDEILGDTQLGDAWYSGVLGGVPSHP